ncbi:MAG: secretin N-terminal domain-containing protein, partial [Pirellulaceae bacterium]
MALALMLDFAWSQSPLSSDQETAASTARSSPFPALREEIAPLAGGAADSPDSYTIPLRQPSTGMVLESDDGLISLVAHNASLPDVLTALAETQGLNLIMQDSVTAQLNTTLHRVPFQDALDVILSTSGHTWVRNRNVIQVTSISNAQNLAPETQGRLVEVFHLDYVSATDVSSVVQTMLSPAGSATMLESSEQDNRRTQEILVVQDLPGYIENIRHYIRKHDVPPRQVLVEAYILKVELSNDMKHGVNFEHFFNMSNNMFQLESRGFANPAANQGFMVNLSGGNLGAVIEMLESTTDAKTLASPKIRVLNGQTARIQVGEQLGFLVTTTTETSTTESVEFLDVGVVLEVTPRISSNGTVVMRVSPEVSSGQTNPDTGRPEKETTELQTDVMF